MRKTISILITSSLIIIGLTSVSQAATSDSCITLTADQSWQNKSNDAATNGETTLLQKFLVSKGYLDISKTVAGYGEFGGYTYGAVRDFQKANGLNATGKLDAPTRAKITELSCGSTSTLPDPKAPQAVARCQAGQPTIDVSWDEAGRGSKGYHIDLTTNTSFTTGGYYIEVPTGKTAITTVDYKNIHSWGSDPGHYDFATTTLFRLRVLYSATNDYSPTISVMVPSCTSGSTGGTTGTGTTTATTTTTTMATTTPTATNDGLIVDPTPHQTFEGWGTSLAWNPNRHALYFTGTNAAAVKKQYMDLLFDKDRGLGLNIVRYNIGGGDNPLSKMKPEYRMDGFLKADGTYDWTVDAAQRSMLVQAKQYAGSDFIAEAFVNSAPYFMTNSQYASGAVGRGDDNLPASNYQAYADYLATVVKHFHDDPTLGITFRTLEPFNEPVVSKWVKGNRQEGMNVSVPAQNTLIKIVGDTLAKNDIASTTISAADEYSITETLNEYNSYDAAARNYLSQVNTHSYAGDKRTELANKVKADGKRIWMSEYGCCFNGAVVTHSIVGALTLADHIIKDLGEMNASAWVMWQPDWGILPFATSTNSFTIDPQYYALLNFTKFIRPGYSIISINDNKAVAAYSNKDHRLVIVALNDGSSNRDVRYNLTRFNNVPTSARLYQTDVVNQFVSEPNVQIVNGMLATTLPPQSISTFVINLQPTVAVSAPSKPVMNSSVMASAIEGLASIYDGVVTSFDTWLNRLIK